MSKPTMKIGGVTVPANLSQKDLIRFLVENKALLIAEKKADKKELDEGFTVAVDISRKYFVDKEGNLNKAADGADESIINNAEIVLCVINTTMFFLCVFALSLSASLMASRSDCIFSAARSLINHFRILIRNTRISKMMVPMVNMIGMYFM